MAEILVQRLRQYELRLLRCSLPLLSSSTHTLHTQATQSSSSFHPLIEEIVTLIESGRYVDSLSSAGARSIFAFSNFFESFDPSQFYAGLEVAVESYLVYNDGEIDSSSKLIMVVAVSVAAFLAFLQCNFIGLVFLLTCLFSNLETRGVWFVAKHFFGNRKMQMIINFPLFGILVP